MTIKKQSKVDRCRATAWAVLVVTTILFSSCFPTTAANSDLELGKDDPSLLEFCRSVGFDPWQLSCETCELLPTQKDIQKHCQACCQSYKTSERMTKPYESAVLIHRKLSSSSAGGGGGGDSEMEQFIRDEFDELAKIKGRNRMMKQVRDDTASSSRYLFMRQPSQMVLFFDEIVEPGLKLKEYKAAAKEIIYLDGYKKDDMKDMLSTLLPDSNNKKK